MVIGYVFMAFGLGAFALGVWLAAIVVPQVVSRLRVSWSARTLLGAATIAGMLFVIAAGGNFAVCVGVSTSLGGSAMNGGFANGSYYLANHSLVTPVSAEIYRRVYQYEVVTTRLLDAAFAATSFGVLGIVIAANLGWLPLEVNPKTVQGALELTTSFTGHSDDAARR